MSLVTKMSLSTNERSMIGPQFWKSTLDSVLACVLMVLTAPVMLLAIGLVRLTSPGPVIYCQTRLGQNGRRYTIYKIRSMYHDCERLTGARWSMPGDKRVTWIGKILRATHIDELPQLWNILRGEMSLVGPRPERPEIAGQLERALPSFRERLLVRPGVTGLAQVQLPPDVDLDSVRRKLACDLYYVSRANLWLDVRILIGTAFGVLGVPFSVTQFVLRLPGEEVLAMADWKLSGVMKTLPEQTESLADRRPTGQVEAFASQTEPTTLLKLSDEMETIPEEAECFARVISS
jgi:lipopolysaccharide/colanic/teichoic acid biosynthesis glycosyltransferase